MDKRIVIGLLGRAGAGKTTFAEFLVREYGAKRVSFAGAVKDLAREVFNFNDDQLFGYLKSTKDVRYNQSPRFFMQQLGQGARNVFGKDFWINTLYKQELDTKYGIFAIDDVRYENEAEFLHWLPGGYVVKLIGTRADEVNHNHPSERSVDRVPSKHINKILQNDYTEESLKLFDEWVACLIG